MAQDLSEVLVGRSPVPPTIPASSPRTGQATELAKPHPSSRSSHDLRWLIGAGILILIGLSIFAASRVLRQPGQIVAGDSPTPASSASLTSVSTPNTVGDISIEATETSTPQPTQTPTPTSTPTPTNTQTPTYTSTPQPTDTPPPTNTPVPPPVNTGTYIENDEIAVTVDSVRFYGPNDDRKGAVYYNIRIKNKTKEKMIVKFSLADIVAKDNKNGQYVDYIVKRKGN
jgi:hypothetical protein